MKTLATDDYILRAVSSLVQNPPHWTRNSLRWACVADALCVGSTMAIAICERYGYNPHEYKGRKRK